jgi:hypothetical protein
MKKIILIVLVVSFFENAIAQENIPYSRYGIGLMQSQQFQSSEGMGNCATTFQHEFMQNPANPASYGALASKAVTFESSLQGRQNILVNGTNSTSYFDMNPAHVGLAAMLHSTEKLKWGIGFNLMPISKVAYNIEESGTSTSSLAIKKQVSQGVGNFYKAQMGNGFKIKDLYFGANVGFIFGSQKNYTTTYYPDTINALATERFRTQNGSGLTLQAGAQYIIKLKKDQKIVIGASYNAQSKLQSTLTESWLRKNNSGTLIDTAKLIADATGKIILPSQFSVGVQWAQGRQWGIATEFTHANWSNFKNLGATDSLKNNWKMGIGAFFTPDPVALQILKRCIYRVGFNYGTDALYLRNQQFSAYSFTAGMSMPVLYKAEENRPMYMFAHFNIESGVSSNKVFGLINQNFLKFNLGVTISGNWFQKRKFD